MTEICPEILIISNKHDFATDHVVYQLNKMRASYLRLNRDQFSNFKVAFIPTGQEFYGETSNFNFKITSESLKSIYFRAPVYLRDIYQPNLSLDEQLHRSQWAAFIRGLTVFKDVVWINHPKATYQAEIKPYQLYLASQIGFDIPETIITNSSDYSTLVARGKSNIIIKTLDPAVLNIHQQEAFIYTNTVSTEELADAKLSNAPIIIQEALIPKIDIRVTVICDSVFAAGITQNNQGIDMDWRLIKHNIQYTHIDLPPEIQTKCIRLIKALDLKFGAIDLALSNNRYYFLEINPTGEWAWLMEHTGTPTDEVIAKALLDFK
jgi:glutathione synthase/RimK-type ligase-like ATP-grasp enzyme